MRLAEFFIIEADDVISVVQREMPQALKKFQQQVGVAAGAAKLYFSDWGELMADVNGKKFEWNAIFDRWERYGK